MDYEAKVVLLGGSGIKESLAFKELPWEQFKTGYTEGPCDGVVEIKKREDGVAFIARHGHERFYGPSHAQYAANLIAAKMMGAKVVIATSAVGSLKDMIEPESLVIPDDIVDESHRYDNLYGRGFVIHAQPRPPFSKGLMELLGDCGDRHKSQFADVLKSGTYVCIPGDRFGTKAEGVKRSMYADIVGMTACPEAMFAMQLGLHYAIAAFVVDNDYDARHDNTGKVMASMSEPDRVPAFIDDVIENAKEFKPGRLHQLEGNIIKGNLRLIPNPDLRRFAYDLAKEYNIAA